jgi:hypothetical protein
MMKRKITSGSTKRRSLLNNDMHADQQATKEKEKEKEKEREKLQPQVCNLLGEREEDQGSAE